MGDHVDAYRNGIGRGWFFRVGYRNTVQVAALARYGHPSSTSGDVRTIADFLIEPTSTADPASCTQLPEYRTRFGASDEIVYNSEDPSTLKNDVGRICDKSGDVVVAYTARGVDTARLLTALDVRFTTYHDCTARSVTILEGSDGSRLRAE